MLYSMCLQELVASLCARYFQLFQIVDVIPVRFLWIRTVMTFPKSAPVSLPIVLK